MKKRKSKVTKKYTTDYYKAQAMLRDPWFTEKVLWLKKRFADCGCPIPTKGFKKYKSYMTWNKKFWDRYSEMEKSQAHKDGVLKITGGKKRISGEEFDRLEKFKEEFLPPVYGQHFREILEHFNIKPDHRRFKDFLEFHVFLGRNEYPESPLQIKWIRNKKTSQMELFVQIYGHTKKNDLNKHWKWVAEEQKHLPEFIGKNKEWVMFDRDIEIYNNYKKLKESDSSRIYNLPMTGIDVKIWAKLHEKYPKLTITNIRTIVAETKKRLGEI